MVMSTVAKLEKEKIQAENVSWIYENLDDILSVDGVDAIQFGPKDLWQSMGMPDRAVVWEVVDRTLERVSRAGLWGSMVAWLDSDVTTQLSRYRAMGVRLVTASPREMLVHGCRYFLDQAAQTG